MIDIAPAMIPNRITEPPRAPTPVARVAAKVIEAHRIAGEARIMPDYSTKMAMQRDGQARIDAALHMCLNRAGTVKSVTLVQSSGYDEYDHKLTRLMQAWQYRPYTVDGVPAGVCTTVTFIYHQR